MDSKPALVVIDLQRGILAVPAVHPVDEIVQRAASLATAFRRHHLPVVLVNVTGRAPGPIEAPSRASQSGVTPPADWADLLDELQPQPDDIRVTKLRWGAFHGTLLDAHLQDLGVTQIVLAGIATSAGVESTARSATVILVHRCAVGRARFTGLALSRAPGLLRRPGRARARRRLRSPSRSSGNRGASWGIGESSRVRALP